MASVSSHSPGVADAHAPGVADVHSPGVADPQSPDVAHAHAPGGALPRPLPPLPADRGQRLAWLRAELGDLVADHEATLDPDALAGLPATRTAALARLAAVDPVAYARTRNFTDGAVTGLSPHIRHGLLGLAEIRDHVVARAGAGATKLVQELAWRAYYSHVLATVGLGVTTSREPLKTGHPEASYGDRLPDDIATGTTGLRCMDDFVATLRDSGWLHNHARMFLAAYVIHWRRVHWRAGAAWMIGHLVDGDLGSNHLSWQWIASSFAAKPYIFNRDTLQHFTHGHHCARCPLAAGGCPFDADYDTLRVQLFPDRVEAP